MQYMRGRKDGEREEGRKGGVKEGRSEVLILLEEMFFSHRYINLRRNIPVVKQQHHHHPGSSSRPLQHRAMSATPASAAEDPRGEGRMNEEAAAGDLGGSLGESCQ
jgi:hypothetical protein